MKLTKNEWLHAGRWIGQWLIVMSLLGMALGDRAIAQAVSTTTVQGTVYLANGRVGAGTLDVSWPAFTTSNSQAITAGRVTVTIGQDGFVSVNLAPNLGAMPAGLYYTAIYHMSDGTTSTEYWVVPAAAQASLGQVRAQLMPSAQAVQAVSKAYVDQSITELTQSLLTATGGTLSGPLYLSGDPTQALQAADKHYVDSTFGLAVPLAGGSMTGSLATPAVNGVQAPAAGSRQTTIQAAVSAAGTSGAVEIPPTYAGSDGFTNPNGVYVTDLRQTGAQQFERSVKEFGAVCDGTTDDTNALQAALNYAKTHGVALTIPQGTCKTHVLSWRGESIGGMGKQVSALIGFPGQDVLATATDSTNLLANTRLHDLTIYVDQSMDVSCSVAEGRTPAGSCAMSRLLESNSIFSPGGNGLTGAVGTGTGWAVGNCAIAMPAATGTSGNGLRLAEIENLEIAATGVDPMAQYTGAHSTHTCGLYLAQWPQWSEFRNIDIRGLNTGIAMPALPGTTPAGLNADSNRWQNITIQATHGFTAAAGSNNVLDNVVVAAANSAATGEPPTGLVLDLTGTQQGWTVRNAVVLPAWNVVTPALTVTAAGGAVTAVTTGSEKGLGFDPYGTTVPLKFSGSCTAGAAANVKNDGSIGTISVTQGGVGCSGTTTASVNVDGTWDTAAPVNLIAGQNMTLFGGNLQKGNGGYTVWNAAGSRSSGTMLGGGGGTLPGGGSYTGLVASSSMGSASQVDQFPGTDFGAKLQACLGSISATYGGTCDARNFTGNLSMASNLTVSTANVTVLLPCATISTAAQVIVTAGTRNVALRGCALRGASTASGSQGGTVFLYSGTGAMVQVGDPTYAADTMGFHLDNVVINTTASSSATAQGLTAYRTQELDLESLYFLGNQNQTGMTLDGTGNYTGGTFFDDAFNGFQTAVNAIGHQVSNAAATDWMNASAFVRLHIDCPTIAGNPISGTYGINLQQGDGNTFTGGDVESCSTALHLGANAQNNTLVGLRNENSTNQVVADVGSSYNNWMTGGTMFTGQLTDNGTRNSFLDTFHRSFNGIKGDWYGSQQDATVTNHYRIGIGTGNERGLLNRYQTDYGYRWTTGLSDATAGEQYYQVLDELNNVNRLSIGQYNNGQSSTNNQTVINAAGTGAIVLNGSNNAGTGGVIIGSGGASESTVATISNAGNALFNGTLQVGGASTFTGSTTVKNQANAEIDQFLWAGTTASQKESFTYKDYNGSSQWYMVKDSNNNWALNSATGGLDSLKAYQSGNSGDTYINTSNSSGVIRLNYESGSSGKTYIYGGTSSSLIAAFSGTTAIAFPGLAASSGHNCLQIDNSGYISNTGSACGTGTGGTNGTVSSGNAGQIAYYSATGTSLSGMSAVPVTAGGTGSSTAAGALTSLGIAPPMLVSPVSGDIAAPLNSAIAACITGSCSFIIAPGNVTASGPIAVNKPVSIQCQSPAATTITLAGYSAVYPVGLFIVTADNVEIAHCGINTNNSNKFAVGVYIFGNHAKIHDNIFTDPGPSSNNILGVRMQGSTTATANYNEIYNNTFTNPFIATSTATNANYNNIHHNYYVNGGEAFDFNGILAYSPFVALDAAGNSFHDNIVDGGTGGSFVENASNSSIQNNVFNNFSNNGAAAVHVHAPGTGTPLPTLIKGNVFTGSSTSGPCVDIWQNQNAVELLDNECTNAGTDGFMMYIGGGSPYHLRIKGNTIRDSGLSNAAGGYCGIHAYQISGSWTTSIPYIDVMGNTAYDDHVTGGGTATQQYGLCTDASAVPYEWVVSGNNFMNNAQGGINFPAGCNKCVLGPNALDATGNSTFTSSVTAPNIPTSATGSGAQVLANSPTLITPSLGVATATSITAGSITPIYAPAQNQSSSYATQAAQNQSLGTQIVSSASIPGLMSALAQYNPATKPTIWVACFGSSVMAGATLTNANAQSDCAVMLQQLQTNLDPAGQVNWAAANLGVNGSYMNQFPAAWTAMQEALAGVTIASGGSGYCTGDMETVAYAKRGGYPDGAIVVTSTDGTGSGCANGGRSGAITGVKLSTYLNTIGLADTYAPSTGGYTLQTGVSLTNGLPTLAAAAGQTGTGSGATVNVTAVGITPTLVLFGYGMNDFFPGGWNTGETLPGFSASLNSALATAHAVNADTVVMTTPQYEILSYSPTVFGAGGSAQGGAFWPVSQPGTTPATSWYPPYEASGPPNSSIPYADFLGNGGASLYLDARFLEGNRAMRNVCAAYQPCTVIDAERYYMKAMQYQTAQLGSQTAAETYYFGTQHVHPNNLGHAAFQGAAITDWATSIGKQSQQPGIAPAYPYTASSNIVLNRATTDLGYVSAARSFNLPANSGGTVQIYAYTYYQAPAIANYSFASCGSYVTLSADAGTNQNGAQFSVSVSGLAMTITPSWSNFYGSVVITSNTYTGGTCKPSGSSSILGAVSIPVPLSLAVSGTANTYNAVNVIQASLATGNSLALQLGAALNSNHNTALFGFVNTGGAGSSTNAAAVGIYGGGTLLVDGASNTTIPGALKNANGTIVPSGATGYTGSSTGKVLLVAGTNDAGITTLVSGTVTVTNTAACSPSASCVYKLTNCGVNASTGVGTLEVGTVSAGASFVINSLSSTASVLTTDSSTVCWQIN